MPRTQLLVGTRKGAFVLESDDGRRDWDIRGPFCESWPVYHAVRDGSSGAIYAAAASEWHGSAVWRSSRPGRDLGALERGARLRGRGRGPQGVEGLDTRGRRRPGAGRRRGARDVREPRRRRDLVAPLDARGPARQRGVGRPGEPAAGASRHLGDHARRRRRVALLGDRAGRRPVRDGRRRQHLDAPQQRAARRLAAASTRRSGSASTGSCARRDPQRMYQQNHVGVHRSDDGGHSWSEITEGLPSEFGFAAAAHPHDRDTFYVIPLDPGHARCMPEGAGGRLAHAATAARAGSGSTRACRSATPTSACCARR